MNIGTGSAIPPFPISPKLDGETSSRANGKRLLPKRDFIDEKSALKIALLLSALYVTFCSLYIIISGAIAARISVSVEHFMLIETIKGISFMVVSGTVFFFFAWTLMKKISRHEHQMNQQREALRASEQRALAGLFASSVAHDINNLLMVAETSLNSIKSKSGKSESVAEWSIEYLEQSHKSLSDLVKHMMTLGRDTHPDTMVETPVQQMLEEVIQFARVHHRLKECKIKLFAENLGAAQLRPAVFQQMLLNLILNAADETQSGESIEVIGRREDTLLLIEVHDCGKGISAEEQEQIFTPFYSTKPQGVGLGLISVKACVEMHGAKLEVENSHLGGACFRIEMPVEDRPSGGSYDTPSSPVLN